ncbi:MAG TPA: hypothetical protein PK264_12875 [Hyphomicrobiaceae bacterium]|nr:hypothetical protein [Hyphomicrobiaceae bacterium]
MRHVKFIAVTVIGLALIFKALFLTGKIGLKYWYVARHDWTTLLFVIGGIIVVAVLWKLFRVWWVSRNVKVVR